MSVIKDIFINVAPAVFILGLLGNIISFNVYLRKKLRTKNTTWFFFLVRTFFDSLIIINSIREFIKERFNFDFVTRSQLICKLTEYYLYFATPISAWSLVIISIDRFYKIKYSKRYFLLSLPKIRVLTVICLCLFNLFFNSPLLILSRLEYDTNGNSSVECVQDESLQFFWWMDLFNSTLLPFICMTIPTSFTIYFLFKSKCKLKRLKKKDIKFAITSISLNFLFIILNLPITLHFLIGSYVEIDDETNNLLYVITDFIYHINYGVMFYINCLVNSIFRNEFLKMISFRRKISVGNLKTINSKDQTFD